MEKTDWFRKRRSKGKEYEGAQKLGATQSTREQKQKNIKELRVRTVLFVDQSPGGELARRIREQMRAMEQTLGFRTKIVERTGATLRSKFPLGKQWI